ncbi:hypothetical protein STCU_10652 [Strigomonas culicis]|uniref:Transmembrane protein n=1 Tax=Strigomonas culicis TaxID=28005 RepID=S9TH34_9TRYP|nr:hypothetical protein STCU_10652 [Strigomonas culicis]|eukprot:EPY17382.1 hypothetical protein STCU_10652 [Strigomonas culicis]
MLLLLYKAPFYTLFFSLFLSILFPFFLLKESSSSFFFLTSVFARHDMSYYGEAARVERCPPQTAALYEDGGAVRHKGAYTIASSSFRPCATHDSEPDDLWSRCHVTDELEVFFHTSAPDAIRMRTGIRMKSKAPNFYRMVCGNVEELRSLNREFTLPIHARMVLSSDFSHHSVTPRGGEQGAALDGTTINDGALLASAFPTIALLVCVGPFKELFLLVLTPHAPPTKKGEPVLSYRAVLRRASASARIVLVAPCGDGVYTLCPALERCAGDMVCCGGSYLSLASARPSRQLRPLLLSARLDGALFHSKRRAHDLVGTPCTYGTCLMSTDGQEALRPPRLPHAAPRACSVWCRWLGLPLSSLPRTGRRGSG